MSQLVVIQCEGVLANVLDPERCVAARPTADGLTLYKGLLMGFTHIAVVSTVYQPDQLRHWLKMGDFAKYDKISCKSTSDGMPSAEWVGGHMTDIYRGEGWQVGPVVSADPNVVRIAMHRGVSAMLMAHPLYMRPEHRPDATRGARPWLSLVEEVEREHEMKRADARMEAEDVIGGFGQSD